MSRFEGLGVKFDQTYLYREYLNSKDYTRRIGPKVDGYKTELSPRKWGEGKLDISKIKEWCKAYSSKAELVMRGMIRQMWVLYI